MSRMIRRSDIVRRLPTDEARAAAIATLVMDALRTEGYDELAVLSWCGPSPSDGEFEAAMSEQHGIEVSAADIKARIRLMVTGPQ